MFSATGCCLLFFIPPPRSPQKRPPEEAMNLRHRLNHLEQKKSNSVSVIGAAVWNWRTTDYEQAPIVLSCRAVALEYLLGVNSWGAREGPYLAAYTFCGVCGRARRVDRPHARILFYRTESFRALPNTASGFLLWKQGVVRSNLTLLQRSTCISFFQFKGIKGLEAYLLWACLKKKHKYKSLWQVGRAMKAQGRKKYFFLPLPNPCSFTFVKKPLAHIRETLLSEGFLASEITRGSETFGILR